jgi:two-component system, NtrC family, nitrogen regulation sensor histidine kinase NtrY
MRFKKFRINILFRIIALTLSVFLLFLTYNSQYYLTPALILVAIIFQIVMLFRYVDRTNRNLAIFLESMRFSEFTRTYKPEGMGSSFDELNKAFNDVIRDFQEVRAEKEEHYYYLQSIIENIDTSIVAFTADGSIELINRAAKRLFQISNLKNIRQLDSISVELPNIMLHIKPGETLLVKINDEEDILQLALHATELRIKSKQITLVTIANIQSVLEEQETEAWQKLIRVLTHEIMNSITPIASLSSTIENMLKQIEPDDESATSANIDRVMLHEISQGLQTINKRSYGLLHFVNDYRNLTRIPKPDFKIVRAFELLNNIHRLFEEEINKKNIAFEISVYPENLTFSADEQLMEQVIINLIKNSVYALCDIESPKIQIKAFLNKRGRVTIQIIDNGPGIIKDVIDKIFIPFFTTKPSGSGIGLSLSRQIIRMHNGTIAVHSTPYEDTVFTITF